MTDRFAHLALPLAAALALSACGEAEELGFDLPPQLLVCLRNGSREHGLLWKRTAIGLAHSH